MSLNPHNPPKTVTIVTTAISIDTSGIVAIAGPLRVPRDVRAEFFAASTAPILGGTLAAGTPGGASASGPPYAVRVIQVSGQSASVQFFYGNLSSLLSGVSQGGGVPSPAQSGVGFSGGTLLTTWTGD